ncbi:MAG: Gfo/Idh/MocA family oxidoreductase [Verrucomicrobiota bacterium]
MKVKGYDDMRHMLEEDVIDVFTTATPNHWHSLAGIWAMQAGKDAYIEKPVSHNVWEGRKLVEAARKYERICQGGTQSRSMATIQRAVEQVQSGTYGEIQYVKGLCYKMRASIGQVGPEGAAIPNDVDYDQWCGPAPMEDPVRRKRFHYDWHWFYEYGNGDMGNQGIHQMDVARWFLGESGLSPRVISIGGRLGYEDDGETPNSQVVYHAYEKAPLIFETRGLPRDLAGRENWSKSMDVPEEFPEERGIAVVVVCEQAKIYCSATGTVKIVDGDGALIEEMDREENDKQAIFSNFIDAVRGRKPEILFSDVEETHVSSALCHTGLISHRLGKKMTRKQTEAELEGAGLMEERFQALAEHLERNEVDLESQVLRVGPWLEMDPDREEFVGNGNLDGPANELARRVYRDPYVVPETV